jgi:hypothetical protein
VIRNIEIIGEAAKNLPDEVIAQAAEVDWRNVNGMRNQIAHGYFGLDTKVVWRTATTKMDEMEAAIRPVATPCRGVTAVFPTGALTVRCRPESRGRTKMGLTDAAARLLECDQEAMGESPEPSPHRRPKISPNVAC